jgi:hypothetical protein
MANTYDPYCIIDLPGSGWLACLAWLTMDPGRALELRSGSVSSMSSAREHLSLVNHHFATDLLLVRSHWG